MLFEEKKNLNAVLFCFAYTVLKSACGIIFFKTAAWSL